MVIAPLEEENGGRSCDGQKRSMRLRPLSEYHRTLHRSSENCFLNSNSAPIILLCLGHPHGDGQLLRHILLRDLVHLLTELRDFQCQIFLRQSDQIVSEILKC